jgi:uncharacterized membrane protein
MVRYVKLYLATLVVFFAIDIIWLSLVAQPFYQSQIGFLLTSDTNWAAAAIFYLLFLLGILVFVVIPGLKEGSARKTLLRGALFGLITYATYDLTNLATLKGWPVLVTIVDLAWGTIISAIVSFASYHIGKRLSITPSQDPDQSSRQRNPHPSAQPGIPTRPQD